MMHSTNQKCNTLQSIIGIFLRTCNTPEKVMKTVAHMGLSISYRTVHGAVNSLNRKSFVARQELGRTRRTSWAFDNFDVDLKMSVPRIERSADMLTHLTSGTFIRLEHGVTVEDLRCSEFLWQKSRLNPTVDASLLPPRRTVADLRRLHPESDHPSGLTHRERYNAWKFRYDLIHHGPEYF